MWLFKETENRHFELLQPFNLTLKVKIFTIYDCLLDETICDRIQRSEVYVEW